MEAKAGKTFGLDHGNSNESIASLYRYFESPE